MNENSKRPRVDSIDDIEKLFAEKDEAILALGTLVRAMDERIRVLTALVDNDHQILIDHGWAPKMETTHASC
jgi:hypothetical protein